MNIKTAIKLFLVLSVVSGRSLFGAAPAAPEAKPDPLAAGHQRLAAKDYAGARAAYARVAGDSALPAACRSIAQLRIAQTYTREGNLAEAKAAYAKIAAGSDVAPHLCWEAQQQIAQLDRQQRGLPARDPSATRVVLPTYPTPGATLFVAPNGSDANPGTADRPLATLTKARDTIRTMKQQGSLPAGGVAVMIRSGRYRMTEALQLDKQDSGTPAAPIVYRAAEGESPCFHGGIRLNGFELVRDPAVLARMPEEARGKAIQVDLKRLGLKDFSPLRLAGFSGGLGFKTHPVMELFFDGRALQLARWPNEGFVRVVQALGPTRKVIHGLKGSAEGVFTYEGDRPRRWKDDPDILLYGYWFREWADSYERVASIDVEKRQITLQPPYSRHGYGNGQAYYAINLLSEIDMPGEWYLDRRNGMLYLYPPSDPAKAVVELSTAATPLVELRDVSHVRFENLTWEIGCVDGVIVSGGEQCLLAGCTVRRFGGNGIDIIGGTKHGVLSCNIESMGRGGVRVAGGNRKTLAPGGHFVENCRIHDLSRIDHTYTPAVWMTGVGNRIAHNLMHDIRSSAINLGGNDHLVECNEICRVVLESDDQGGVDMFGNPTYRGNVYRYNYFHHVGNWHGRDEESRCGRAGIRLDDAICGTLLYGNVFRRCATGKAGFGGVQIHGGKENIVDGNLFVDCRTAISFSPWNEKHWLQHISDAKYALTAPDIDKELYLARYPALAKLPDDHDVNFVWRNLVVDCGEFLRRDRGLARLCDNLVTADKSGFTDAPRGVFEIVSQAAALDRVSLVPIPFAEIGLYRDAFRKSLPTREVERMRSTGEAAR